ncbi:hypothetical protein Tco_0519304 [Tanacetum coccineum]
MTNDGGYKCHWMSNGTTYLRHIQRCSSDQAKSTTTMAFSSPPTQKLLSTLLTSGLSKRSQTISNFRYYDMFQPERSHPTIIKLCLINDYLGLKGQELQCCRFFGASSIELISIMRKGSGTTHSGKEESHSHCDPNAKGTKREVFGMPIPNELITDDIRGADYYNAYLKKVAKHHRYLAGEEVSDPDSPAPKPAKSTKPKITKQTKPVAPKAATKKPQPAPTKPKEKKRKQDKETTEATPPAKRTKAGKVAKKRTLKRSQQLVDEVVDEGIPLTEPGFGDLEADTQRAIEESNSHFPEVEGKGKEKVGVEQAARVLLNL